jgi:signal peptidase I
MHFVRRAAGALGTLVLAVLAALAITTATGWIRITPVLTGSMRGAFNPGDALLSERVPASSLQVGDVVDAKVPPAVSDGSGQRVHRIVSLRHVGSAVVVRTKGDANTIVDPGSLTLRGDQYLMRARLPYVGWITDFKAANGLRLLIEAIAGLTIISIGQQLWLARRGTRRRDRHGRRDSRSIRTSFAS